MTRPGCDIDISHLPRRLLEGKVDSADALHTDMQTAVAREH